MSDPFLKDSWPIDFFVRCEVPLVEECSRVLRLVSFRPTLEGNLLNTLGNHRVDFFAYLRYLLAFFVDGLQSHVLLLMQVFLRPQTPLQIREALTVIRLKRWLTLKLWQQLEILIRREIFCVILMIGCSAVDEIIAAMQVSVLLFFLA